jgi:hypothetical protein
MSTVTAYPVNMPVSVTLHSGLLNLAAEVGFV